jgi:membrane-bound inhibitor of C-type lysozyme/phosphoglycolate phosphatase-like HAD superfamily hydrolase
MAERASALDPAVKSSRVFTRALAAAALLATGIVAADALDSWNDLPSKQAIIRFVRDATTPDTTTFIPPAERIAVFDNDGTLWAEQPIYFQFAFALDRVKALAPKHPEWKSAPPFDAILRGDMAAFAASGEKGLMEVLAITHAGMTTDEFSKTVTDWLATARHPRFGKPYTDLVYAPMLELLAYLREAGFKTYIVSGGGAEFMRAFAEKIYGIPPEQVIGSTGELEFRMGADGKPVLLKLPKVNLVDDKAGKPVGIQRFIGRRPVFAFGNSDGDQQMLEWTAAGPGVRFMGIVHHTDAEREFAYDRKSSIGRLDKALDEANAKGWVVVDMKEDWNRIFAFEAEDSGAAGAERAFIVNCASDVSFTVRVAPGQLELSTPPSLGGRQLVLHQVPAASGARYEDGDTVYWDHGGSALIEVAGRRFTECRLSETKAP